jgi:Protein of unknown function (DUF2914).
MRVNIDDDTHHDQRPEEIIEYRWDRIISALLALVLLLAGGWYALAPSPTPAPLFSPVRVIVPVDRPDPGKAVEAGPPTVVAIKGAPGATSDDGEPVSEAAQSQLTIVGATPSRVEILSDKLVRARLTRNVVNREPVGVAPALIPMNARGLIRVFLFTELDGLKGQMIHHDWYLNNQRMARVTMRPQGERITASSSKYIDQHMRGDWRVEVITDQGEPLARSEFEVR